MTTAPDPRADELIALIVHLATIDGFGGLSLRARGEWRQVSTDPRRVEFLLPEPGYEGVHEIKIIRFGDREQRLIVTVAGVVVRPSDFEAALGPPEGQAAPHVWAGGEHLPVGPTCTWAVPTGKLSASFWGSSPDGASSALTSLALIGPPGP